jgi:hypothetical protein
VGWLEKERKSPESKKQRKLQCKKGNEAKSKKQKAQIALIKCQ